MRSTLLALLSLLISFSSLAQQFTIKGKITDEGGAAIPFAIVYIKNTTKGATANADGEYSLQLAAGSYEVQYRGVGYKQISKVIDLEANQTINITLSVEIYQLKSVVIRSGGEDPAYAIIRKAIKKRKTYLNEVKGYTCQVYIKGLQKLLSAPKKFMGVDVQKATNEAGLDSNRRGIVYLSESESNLSFERPDKIHEVQVYSKVSGDNRAFSYNRSTDLKVNFYDNTENWNRLSNRPLISPIADNALFYYRYTWMGSTYENGETINKIRITPRRSYDACFSGYIYILDDSWRIYGLDMYITKTANINFVDTLKVNQQFFPVNAKVWMPASIKFEFTGGAFGFRLGGYFISIYKNYDLNPTFNKRDFNEVLRITNAATKTDTAFWNSERPIPLTAEEKADYINKNRLAIKRGSKPYLDSLDHADNKFKPTSLILKNYHHTNRYKHEDYEFNSLLSSLVYNTVEGFAINYGASYTKLIDSVNNKNLKVRGNVRYGFSDKLFNGSIHTSISIRERSLNFDAGSDIIDLNYTDPISTKINSLYSLLRRENYQKLYQKQFISASIFQRINGGWLINASAEWANRKWLPNTSSYSLFHPNGHEFTSNNPLVPDADVPLFPDNQALKITFRSSYDFSDRYITLPYGRYYLPSKWPTIGINYIKGIKDVLGSDVDYDLLSADIAKTDIKMGVIGRTSFFAGAGKFLNNNKLYFPDYKQFLGNEVVAYKYHLNSFLLLDYYRFSTFDKYIEGHLEHNFSGFIVNKIPLVRKLRLKEILDVNYLTTPQLKNYTELGFGLQYLNFRVMYGHSYNSASQNNSAIRISASFR